MPNSIKLPPVKRAHPIGTGIAGSVSASPLE